eukprot:Plantae.Rhodophyta-Rhodochaete_pulchella.ctg2966.p1 GENE.Plantae.Rhodophyta-Rhodochaete_pulchella.ctg2966~~Plantae.Rhodophyta-Rhodochaete_pulchella.ctg2966.p1  ORF type:complete len:222 (+),score=12.98 Plantae.Rhodophyta-Rhodochaete_pulchella.ctg2966:601-1266(+)
MPAAVKLSVGLRPTGTTASVPNDKIAKLMYYLSCVLRGCGLAIIKDELLDYTSHQRLTRAQRDAVIVAAYTYSPDELLNKVIFLDDDGELCGTSQNEFFEITTAAQFLAVQEQALLGGDMRQINKIMVFRRSWLVNNYFEPMRQCEPRLKELLGLTSKHCSHCNGQTGRCACMSGCPRRGGSECMPLVVVIEEAAATSGQASQPSSPVLNEPEDCCCCCIC